MRAKSAKKSPEAKVKSERVAEASAYGGRSHTPVYEASFARVARAICRLGGSDLDLADALGVDEGTIEKWVQEHAEFREACRFGIDAADASVERSLLQRALGYDRTDVKVFRRRGRTIYAPYRVHVMPDVKAAIYWLAARRPDKWSLKGGKAKPASTETEMAALLRQLREIRRTNGGALSKAPT